jgi:hypothetical protein
MIGKLSRATARPMRPDPKLASDERADQTRDVCSEITPDDERQLGSSALCEQFLHAPNACNTCDPLRRLLPNAEGGGSSRERRTAANDSGQ